jgi:predicted metal-dependent hydrolase
MNALEIDEIIRSRRKTIALIVKPDGRLVVRAPITATRRQIMNFVHEKSEWIRSSREKVKNQPITPKKQFVEGERFWYLGKTYPIKLVSNPHPALTLKSSFLLSRSAVPNGEDTFKKWYQTQARAVLTRRVQELANQNGFAYKKIRITSARTRWGSCSTRGSLNFSWRLIMAPEDVIDYVIVHELVHTKIHNHSRQFWNQVALIMPDYAKKRNWLKINGRLLTIN